MNYINAAEILPENLIKEIQTYIDGVVLYIPKTNDQMRCTCLLRPIQYNEY